MYAGAATQGMDSCACRVALLACADARSVNRSTAMQRSSRFDSARRARNRCAVADPIYVTRSKKIRCAVALHDRRTGNAWRLCFSAASRDHREREAKPPAPRESEERQRPARARAGHGRKRRAGVLLAKSLGGTRRPRESTRESGASIAAEGLPAWSCTIAGNREIKERAGRAHPRIVPPSEVTVKAAER